MEIERKFLCTDYALVHLEPTGVDVITQGYLAKEPSTVRIRAVVSEDDEYYYLTVKTAGLMIRQEVEFIIDSANGDELMWIAKALYPTVSKSRYYFEINGTVVSVDVFSGRLSGLMLAEVEFNSVEEAEAFVPFDWMTKEVTHDKSYANSNL